MTTSAQQPPHTGDPAVDAALARAVTDGDTTEQLDALSRLSDELQALLRRIESGRD